MNMQRQLVRCGVKRELARMAKPAAAAEFAHLRVARRRMATDGGEAAIEFAVPTGSSAWRGVVASGAVVAAVLATLQATDADCESLDRSGADRAAYFDEDYEATQLVGSGTFGMVMQCVSKKDGHVAAVKMIHDVNDIREEVIREKEALASIQLGGGHGNIVRYEGCYEHDGFHYIVTEYVDGESMYEFIQKNRQLDVVTALQLTSQLASALAFLRARNLIHRDLKPENIMVQQNCEAEAEKTPFQLKIIDFGSAETYSKGPATKMNEARAMALSGTRCYWPPEVLLSQETSPAMDMWALGCMLYIMVAGRHPFDMMGSSSEDEIVHRITTENISFLHPVWTDVPCSVKSLIRGLLEKDPNARLAVDEVLVHPALPRFTKMGVQVTKATAMELISSVDQWRFEQRRRDAEAHSLSLVREIPLSLVPPLFPAARQPHPFQTREDFRKLLRERVGGDEYGASGVDAPRLEKENLLESNKRHNVNLASRLAKALAHQEKIPLAGKIDKRKNVLEVANRFGRKTRPNEPYGKKYQMKNKDEIEELQAKLQGYRIDRDAEDTLFYDLIAERERNVLLEEVLRELVEDEAIDAFEEAEAAARKKELPPEQLQFVMDAIHDGPHSEVLVQKYNVDITRRHLQCMLPLQWLNDEVINFWFQLLNDRDEELVKCGALPKRSHFFNSFFYTKVSEGGYNFVNVRRWTKKIDLFAMDKIFVPVNVSNTHWCLAVIFMTEKRIQYFDSMNGAGQHCLDVLLTYLQDEMQHKKSQTFDTTGWRLVSTEPGTPQQENGSDCGVFTCMFADYLSRNEPLSFSQKDMEFHRHRMVLHVVHGELPLEEDL